MTETEAMPQSSADLHHKKSSANNSSSNGVTGETSFMTVLQQAGMGGRAAKNASVANASQLDDIISNFVSHHVKKLCYKLVGGTVGDSKSDLPPLPASVSKVSILISSLISLSLRVLINVTVKIHMSQSIIPLKDSDANYLSLHEFIIERFSRADAKCY